MIIIDTIHDVTEDVKRKKESKKERKTPEAMEKNENESCLMWDSNLRHSQDRCSTK